MHSLHALDRMCDAAFDNEEVIGVPIASRECSGKHHSADQFWPTRLDKNLGIDVGVRGNNPRALTRPSATATSSKMVLLATESPSATRRHNEPRCTPTLQTASTQARWNLLSITI